MARRMLATAFGGPEVLTLVDEPLEAPGPGEVAVTVRAIGTNPVDYKLFAAGADKDPSRLPMTVGAELAGIVTAVGADAMGPAGPFQVGDEVIGYPVPGAYADAVVVDAGALVPKPPTLSFEEASGLLLTGVTAAHAISATGVEKGDTVVIHGAAGGVGLLAIQLARLAGARVLATAGPASQSLVAAMGAEPVPYGDGLLERLESLAPDGVDAAIDLVGTDEALDVSVALVADRARIATIAGFARGPGLGIKVLGNGPGGDPGTALRRAARLRLVELAGSGALSVTIAATYPLEQAAEALAELARGHSHGKIVLIA